MVWGVGISVWAGCFSCGFGCGFGVFVWGVSDALLDGGVRGCGILKLRWAV